jgi:hypothetical protein
MDKLNDDMIKNIIMHVNYNRILFLTSKKFNNIIKCILSNNDNINSWIIPKKLNIYSIPLDNTYNKSLKEYKMKNRIVAFKLNNINNLEIIGGFKNDYHSTIINDTKLVLNTNIKINCLYSESYINKWRLGNWQIYNCYCSNESMWINNNFIKNDFIDKLLIINNKKCDVLEKFNNKNVVNFKKFKINNLPIIYNDDEYNLITNNISYYTIDDTININYSIYFPKDSNIYIKTKTVGLIFIIDDINRSYNIIIFYENNNQILIRTITNKIKITNNNIFTCKPNKLLRFRCLEIYDNIIAVRIAKENNVPATIDIYNIITGELIYRIEQDNNEYIKIEPGSIFKIKIKNKKIYIQTNFSLLK